MAEVRDRDATIERAEALQSWLLGFPLSGRAKGAFQRELEAIIADGTGGDHPLAGLTIADFIAELHSPNGGDVGRVKSVGEGVLKELRAAIPPDTRAPRKARKSAKTADAKPRRRQEASAANGTTTTNGFEPVEAANAPEPVTAPQAVIETSQAEAPQAEAPQAEAPQAEALEVETSQAEAPQAEEPQAEPVRRRPGRPKGSGKAAQNGTGARQEAPVPAQERTEAPTEAVAVEAVAVEAVAGEEAAPKRRGRPRRTEAPAQPAVSSPATNGTKPAATKAAPAPIAAVENKAAPKVSEADPVLAHIIQLWPSLHPQARRAVVYYASDLLAGVGHEG